MSSWIDKLLEKPFFYDNLRAAITFGIRYSPIRKAIGAMPGESILDLGCGTGTYSKIFKNSDNAYTGVEISRTYYETACLRHQSNHVQFIHSDFFQLESISPKSFDLSLMTGVLHHLTDDECRRILSFTASVTKKQLVIQDLAPSRYHFISNLLMKMDRGKFTRGLDEQKKLISEFFNIQSFRCYYTNSGLAKHSLFQCEPR